MIKTETKVYGCDHVQQSWLNDLPWKMQTVINQGLRAPDTHYCKSVKLVCRWMRGVVLQNADENHTFMCQKESLPQLIDLENEINYCSVHFATHFVYALEIIALEHPDEKISDIALKYYQGIVSELWHFNPETQVQLRRRLADVDHKPTPPACPTNPQKDNYVYKA